MIEALAITALALIGSTVVIGLAALLIEALGLMGEMILDPLKAPLRDEGLKKKLFNAQDKAYWDCARYDY